MPDREVGISGLSSVALPLACSMTKPRISASKPLAEGPPPLGSWMEISRTPDSDPYQVTVCSTEV